MFNGCYSLQSVPLFNLSSGTNFTQMFYNCTSLQEIPILNVLSATGSGIFGNIFGGCPNLKIGALSGSKSTINYTGCSLDRSALVNIFKNLSTTGSLKCSITTSLNWGSSSLTISDKQIATNKGWTLLP
jgi:hypothetical protein